MMLIARPIIGEARRSLENAVYGAAKTKLGVNEVAIPADYLGTYAVTQEEWEKVTGDNPSQN